MKYYENTKNDDKIYEYKEKIVNHAKELAYDSDPYLNEKTAKEILCSEILNKMENKVGADIIRRILFSENNAIDWNEAVYVLLKYMPELKIK